MMHEFGNGIGLVIIEISRVVLWQNIVPVVGAIGIFVDAGYVDVISTCGIARNICL